MILSSGVVAASNINGQYKIAKTLTNVLLIIINMNTFKSTLSCHQDSLHSEVYWKICRNNPVPTEIFRKTIRQQDYSNYGVYEVNQVRHDDGNETPVPITHYVGVHNHHYLAYLYNSNRTQDLCQT
jgi:hypothetical protein